MSERGGPAELIRSGRAILGIEFGSTRIKASLIAPDTTPLAYGSHAWENRLSDGLWTYDMEDVEAGLAGSYAALRQDVRARYALELETVAAMGVSGMMHGYLALDADGRLLVPFRTWRNNVTARASAELTTLLDFAVPQRWSIAHLYQSILQQEPHVPRIARLTTLAGYVHWKLTGEHKLGVGEASGMFPIDGGGGDWDAERIATVDAVLAPGRSDGGSATSSRRSCPSAAWRGRSPLRAHGSSIRRAASLPAYPCARRRAMPAPAWSRRMRSAHDRGTSRPAHPCSR